jgi:hypothetical protein
MSKGTSFRVSNESSQREKRETLENDQRVRNGSGSTYFGFAESEASAIGGRFAVESKQRVIGSSGVEYPALPANSPWHCDPVPPEPSLGMPIDAMEPVGTHVEIEKSLREMRDELGPPPGALPDSPTRRGPRSTRLTPSDVSSRPRRPSRKND